MRPEKHINDRSCIPYPSLCFQILYRCVLHRVVKNVDIDVWRTYLKATVNMQLCRVRGLEQSRSQDWEWRDSVTCGLLKNIKRSLGLQGWIGASTYIVEKHSYTIIRPLISYANYLALEFRCQAEAVTLLGSALYSSLAQKFVMLILDCLRMKHLRVTCRSSESSDRCVHLRRAMWIDWYG